MVKRVDAVKLRKWLGDGDEIALLDIRNGGPYSRDHILVASGVPRANFETHVPRLVPRRSTRLVLTDDDGSTLDAAAEMLESHGYSNVHVLEDGNRGWTAAGFRLYSGSNIVSKVFGEMVEAKYGTPHVDAGILAAWMTEGRTFRLFDVRPLAEYRTVSIPGATNCPGMEGVLRIPAQLDNDDVPIVVNCAGRTRSIIGAQSLRDAGITNPVFALENGTMGWQLRGFEPDHGQSNITTEPFGSALESARESAREFAARNEIRFVDVDTVQRWTEEPLRTTYVFDVRLAEAFSLGRFPGSMNAPGGQLIQNTDTFAAVRNARMVLVDEHNVQSVMTAHWMSRMGWDVAVLSDSGNHLSDTGADPAPVLHAPDPRATIIDGEQLRALVDSGRCVIVDVGDSYWYRQGRIPGSHWAMRSKLAETLSRFNRDSTLVFVCTSGNMAPFAAGDAIACGFTDVCALAGGRGAWRRAGGEFETIGDVDDDLVLNPTDDMWYPPWARAEGAREAMAEYLSWEVGLVDRVRSEEYLRFSDEFDITDFD